MTVIRTYSGHDIDLLRPDPKLITIRDIAHHLALVNRFNGATAFPYSVAQHSVIVARIVGKLGGSALDQFRGLMHDAEEAYLGDFTHPVQQVMSVSHTNAHVAICEAIEQAFNFSFGTGAAVSIVDLADNMALATEWRDMMQGPCPATFPAPCNFVIKPQDWAKAEEGFLKTFARLQIEAGLTVPRHVPSDLVK